MRNKLEIGPTPPEEECAQVGSDDYQTKARRECNEYIKLIRRVIGPEPEGANLKITSNPHDFGTYYEVAVAFDDENQKAIDYAYKVESNGPAEWDDEARQALYSETALKFGAIRREEKEHAHHLTDQDISELMFDSVVECADGCEVEPDGVCPHGYQSPLLVLGLI